MVSNQEGNCSVGCFPSRVWREKLAVLWPFVKRTVTICHKHIVTSFDYSAKAQINLSDGINIICVYILNLSKHTFSRRSRSNITQKGHTNWNSTRKLKCLGINGEYHSSISATVVFVLKCVKKIEKMLLRISKMHSFVFRNGYIRSIGGIHCHRFGYSGGDFWKATLPSVQTLFWCCGCVS